jgi:hypothetical protein
VSWSEKNPPKTIKPIAFGALQRNVSLTNNEVHALLRRGALAEWAMPDDLLLELKKSYYSCAFDDRNRPTKIIFKGEDSTRFYEDFEAFHAKLEAAAAAARQPG